MRKLISLILLVIIAVGVGLTLAKIPFGTSKSELGEYYIRKGRKETGATNIVASVVVNYRGFDTLGEVSILFTAALGVAAVLSNRSKKKNDKKYQPASLILHTGCRFLFPLILLVGAYVFIHGHLTPGGGFQGGVVVASAFLLIYLGCRERRISGPDTKVVESLAGLIFVVVGLLGLAIGGYFLLNFLPKGISGRLFSAGVISVIYIAIGLKVGSELTGIIDSLIEEAE